MGVGHGVVGGAGVLGEGVRGEERVGLGVCGVACIVMTCLTEYVCCCPCRDVYIRMRLYPSLSACVCGEEIQKKQTEENGGRTSGILRGIIGTR